MTLLGLSKRLAATWLAVAWFSFFVLDLLGDYDTAGRILRAVVAGFFVALTTAPAYYWRLKADRHNRLPNEELKLPEAGELDNDS